MIKQFQGIRDVGLPTFLNETKDKHNGFGYDHFAVMANSGVNSSNLARAFNVTRQTINKWLDIYKEEQGK